MKTKKLLTYLFITVLFSAPLTLHAQRNDTDATNQTDAGAPPAENNDAGAPLDGGVTLLLAAGVGYGVKKYRDSRKTQEGENQPNEK